MMDKNKDSKYNAEYKTISSHQNGVNTDVCVRYVSCLVVFPFSPGQISLEEFIEGAKKDPWVMEQLQLDIRPCDWFNQHQKKKL